MTILKSNINTEDFKIGVTFDTENKEFGLKWDEQQLMTMDATLFLEGKSDRFTPYPYIENVMKEVFDDSYTYSDRVMNWKYNFLEKVKDAMNPQKVAKKTKVLNP